MKTTTAGLNQQGQSDLHNAFELVWKLAVGILNVLWHKLFNVDDEHLTLQELTVHFFGIILKHGIECCKSWNFWSKESISVKFSKTVINSFPCKS